MPRAIKKAGTFQRHAWTKMVNGKRRWVHCRDLGLPEEEWTEIGSYQAAIAHWEKVFPEINGGKTAAELATDQIRTVLEQVGLDGLVNLVNQGQAAGRLIEIVGNAAAGSPIIAEVESLLNKNAMLPLETIRMPSEPIDFDGHLPLPKLPSDDERVNHLRQMKTTVLAKAKVETIFTLTHHAARFLEIERARTTKATTYGELADYIGKLVEMVGGETDARTVNEQTVTTINLTLRKKYGTVATRKKVWGFFKRLVRHLWSERLIELPRNLDEKKFAFRVRAKKVKRYDLGEVKGLLKRLPERLKLYALLGLNCGMLGVDMANVKLDELDQTNWRITRKRTKTEEEDDCPEVNYKLWPITAKLLKKHIADHNTLVLTSKTNTPLWTVWVDPSTGKKKKKDLISLQWKRRELPISLKAFRSISATIIGDHENYGRYSSHFLGHSPKSIADKHYVAPSPKLFDEIMTYVGKELGLV